MEGVCHVTSRRRGLLGTGRATTFSGGSGFTVQETQLLSVPASGHNPPLSTLAPEQPSRMPTTDSHRPSSLATSVNKHLTTTSAGSPLSPLAVTSQSHQLILNVGQPLSQLHSHGVQHPEDEAAVIPTPQSPSPLLPPRSPSYTTALAAPASCPSGFFPRSQLSLGSLRRAGFEDALWASGELGNLIMAASESSALEQQSD